MWVFSMRVGIGPGLQIVRCSCRIGLKFTLVWWRADVVMNDWMRF